MTTAHLDTPCHTVDHVPTLPAWPAGIGITAWCEGDRRWHWIELEDDVLDDEAPAFVLTPTCRTSWYGVCALALQPGDPPVRGRSAWLTPDPGSGRLLPNPDAAPPELEPAPLPEVLWWLDTPVDPAERDRQEHIPQGPEFMPEEEEPEPEVDPEWISPYDTEADVEAADAAVEAYRAAHPEVADRERLLRTAEGVFVPSVAAYGLYDEARRLTDHLTAYAKTSTRPPDIRSLDGILNQALTNRLRVTWTAARLYRHVLADQLTAAQYWQLVEEICRAQGITDHLVVQAAHLGAHRCYQQLCTEVPADVAQVLQMLRWRERWWALMHLHGDREHAFTWPTSQESEWRTVLTILSRVGWLREWLEIQLKKGAAA